MSDQVSQAMSAGAPKFLWPFHDISQAERWLQVESNAGVPPLARSYTSSVIHRESLYIFGGKGLSGGSFTYLNDLHKFHIPTKKWSLLFCTGTTPQRRACHSTVIRKDQMYLFGGRVWGNGSANILLDDFYRFNFGTVTWNLISPGAQDHSPSARSGHMMVTSDNFLFVFGGYVHYVGVSRRDNDMHEFNYEEKRWRITKQKGKLPSPRHSSGWCSHGDSAYLFGGYDGEYPLGDLYRFTMGSRTWTEILLSGQVPPGLTWPSCVSYGDSMYIFGGRYSDKFNELYRYRYEDGTCTRINVDACPPSRARRRGTAEVYGHSMYVFGGVFYADTPFNRFVEYRFNPRITPPSTFARDILRIATDPDLADVNFLVDGQIVSANKGLLQARSWYFQCLLASGMKESQAGASEPIKLTDISVPTFELLVQYLASDAVALDVSLPSVLDLLIAADKYDLGRLVSVCEHVIARDISVGSVAELLIAAHHKGVGAERVKKICTKFISRNLVKVLKGKPNLLHALKDELDLIGEISGIIVAVDEESKRGA